MNKLIRQELHDHLTGTIIPFWDELMDNEYGGFYGYMGSSLTLDKQSEKGGILNSRILWMYSNAYMLLNDKTMLFGAQQAFNFLKTALWDNIYGGTYWSANYDGTVCSDIKHSYCLAFALYGLSSYYRATGDKDAIDMADELFALLETKCRGRVGYIEALSREFKEIENDELSENGVLAKRTMNTLLHILEAYTEYYLAVGDKKIQDAICYILRLFLEKVYDEKQGRLRVFFDEDYNEIIDLYSYGHDIEASWLIDKACEVVDDKELIDATKSYTAKLVKNVLERAFDGSSLNNECEKGVVDKKRVWWVQAEAIVGCLNAYASTGDSYYMHCADSLWEYIKQYLVDKREGGEWYWAVDEKGRPIMSLAIVEPWKCPYHNGRMCMEVLKRCPVLNNS